jgi:NADPH:quinone reductase-like Zn-dependent oxidoreductase
LGVPAGTAHNAVFSDGPVDGQTILVSGGAGAVGHYAVQFAVWGGATVITTVSSAEKEAHARAAGAHQVIDYKTEDVVARIMDLTGKEGVDRVVEVDFGANLDIDVEIIKENGVIASYSSTAVPEPVLPYYPLAYKAVTVHFVQAYILKPAARRAAIDDITELLTQGTLINTIAARFPLGQIAAAHEAQESGRLIGNVIVEID